ncbi:hypothetical protein QYF36_007196 [Acer negundo]|nr:hypothetical protein QYF36_007196 [Acer negundo]
MSAIGSRRKRSLNTKIRRIRVKPKVEPIVTLTYRQLQATVAQLFGMVNNDTLETSAAGLNTIPTSRYLVEEAHRGMIWFEIHRKTPNTPKKELKERRTDVEECDALETWRRRDKGLDKELEGLHDVIMEDMKKFKEEMARMRKCAIQKVTHAPIFPKLGLRETIRSYMNRFIHEAMMVEDFNNIATVTSFTNGLQKRLMP